MKSWSLEAGGRTHGGGGAAAVGSGAADLSVILRIQAQKVEIKKKSTGIGSVVPESA
jgi:homoaconitase/3-isopropylmalate dehydratase large subunit